MSYISFNKGQLVNLEFSLDRELLRSNRSGAFLNTTICGCNTRKYHGLLVVPQPSLDSDNHILLSSIDETIIEQNEEFHFGVRMYPNGVFSPRGHKYLRDFVAEPIPKLTYRVGSVVLNKEYIFAQNEARLLIRYTLSESASPITLRLKPFLSFRNIHQLTRENYDANRKYTSITNGASWQMYAGYSHLFFQVSKETEYTHVPHWYYNVEYIREIERGYQAQEDLYVPGFFEIQMKKGDSIVISVGLEEKDPKTFKRLFNSEIKKRIPRNSYENCLINSAQQFFVKNGEKTQIMAGFPWFGSWSRDTFMALPGLTLTQKDETTFNAVVNTMIDSMKGPFFPHSLSHNKLDYAAIDAPLWFFWCIYQYEKILGKQRKDIWKKYKDVIITIIESYCNGTDYNIKMRDDGLLWGGDPTIALTWMDVYSNGIPITPRYGMAVEVNMMWFNALTYASSMAKTDPDALNLAEKWFGIVEKIKKSFIEVFWDEEKGYLADFVNDKEKNMMVRPNMISAVSLPVSPLTDEMKMKVYKVVRSELLTPRGLRSLSPQDSQYKGTITGNQYERDHAYHQGTVFPWFLSQFCDATLHLHGKSRLSYIEDLYYGFEAIMLERGIGSVSEVYDGDPPHEGRGAISQAVSVAALLRIKYLIEQNKTATP